MWHSSKSGFTLIELIVTLAIVTILASAVVPLGELVVQRRKEQDLRRALRDVREAIDLYKQASNDGRLARKIGESGYPKRLEDLVEGVDDLTTPNKTRIYFLRRIPRDPLADEDTLPAADTWGKRSYASAPDEPKEGEDVFDIYSLAPGKGINGKPYRQW